MQPDKQARATSQHAPSASQCTRTLSSSGVDACSRPAQCSACSCARLSCSPPSWWRSLPSGVCCCCSAAAAFSAASWACAAASWLRIASSSAAAAVARCCAASAAACAVDTACRASSSCAASCTCCWLDRLAVSSAAASLAASFCRAASSSATSSFFSFCGKAGEFALNRPGSLAIQHLTTLQPHNPPLLSRANSSQQRPRLRLTSQSANMP